MIRLRNPLLALLSTLSLILGIAVDARAQGRPVTANRTGAHPLNQGPPGPFLSCTPTTGPVEVGAFYSSTCTATQGTPPYTWMLVESVLPPGLTLNAPNGSTTATVSGTPTQAGNYSYDLRVIDSTSPVTQSADQMFSGAIAPRLAVTAPSSLSPGMEGVSYGPITFTASGGTGGYRWSAAGLPSGLAFSAGGLLSGTPVSGSRGIFRVTATVTDSSSISATTTLSLIVDPSSPTITAPGSLSPGSEGVAYGQVSFTTAGGTGGYTWAATGLPGGLMLSASGILSGTPANGNRGSYRVSATVTDSSSTTASVSLPLTIGPATLTVTAPTSLSAAAEGTLYGPVPFTASGGTSPYLWSATGLPSGVTLSASGVLSGTPAAGTRGAFSVRVTVVDFVSASASLTLPLTVNPAGSLTITSPGSLTPGTEGTAYSQVTFAATGGIGPYRWSASGLPNGLSLSTAGVLSGVPGVGSRGPYNVQVSVQDAANSTAISTLALTINPSTMLTISAPTLLPAGTEGLSFGPISFSATGGTGGYAWDATGLPNGLTLSHGGVLSGTPSTGSHNQYSVQVKVTDSSNAQASVSLALIINSSSSSGLTISPTALSGAREGLSYGPVVFSATGGTGIYIWSASGLPAGLALSAAGVLSGTPFPGSRGAYSVRVVVTDSNNASNSSVLQLSVTTAGTGAGPVITSSGSLHSGAEGSVYGPVTLSAFGGTGAYIWSASGLPAGLTLSPTGILSGTPAFGAQGNYNPGITVTDSSGASTSVTLSLTIRAPALSLSCSSGNGPTQVGVTYSTSCSVPGGTTIYQFSIVSGSLPAGLTLSGATGQSFTIAGAPLPSAAGPYSYTVQAVETGTSSPQTTSQTFSGIIVPPKLQISCSMVSSPTAAGVPFNVTCTVSGGTAPYSWAVSSGSLPAGLALNSGTGASISISGTPLPSSIGNYAFTITVTDSTKPVVQTGSQIFTGTIVPGQVLTLSCSSSNGPVKAGTGYLVTCSATGGAAPYRFSATGDLPAGLALTATGPASASVGGTPTRPGPYSYSIVVTDAAPSPASASSQYAGVISPQSLSISCTNTLATADAGVPYQSSCAASGGTEPYQWSVSAGALPPGLALTAMTGAAIVMGTPTKPGIYRYTLQVTDSSTLVQQQTASQTFTVTIAGPDITSTTLPNGVVGNAYSFSLIAANGSPPYVWSIGAGTLPSGLSLNSGTGLISGTPGAPGTSRPTIQVSDSGQATSSATFDLTILLPAPAIDFGGLPATANPAQQLDWTVTLSSSYPVPLSGQVILTFVPDSGLPDDPSIQFSTGGRAANFTISAGSKTAPAPLAFQTGTVAGSLVFTVRLSAAGQDVTPVPTPSYPVRVNALPPSLSRVTLSKSSGGIDVQITGFSTSRQITAADFQFNPATGSSFKTTELSVPTQSTFSAYFQGAESLNYGSMFTFTQHFQIQGNVEGIGSVTVMLENQQGKSQPVTAAF